MTRRFLRASTLLVLLLLTASLSNSVLAGHEQGPTFSSPRPLDSSLMETFQKNLSGSAWLMAEGLDPRLTTIKGNPLGKLFPPQDVEVRGISPQAGGGGQGPLVPYRSPSPKFSRNILVTRDFSNSPMQTEPMIAVNPLTAILFGQIFIRNMERLTPRILGGALLVVVGVIIISLGRNA